ncbi:unnamed protein product [Bemisia tabaci]|uniref:Cytochrome P450 n=2 Tax=Bemisia tabaci TaxID=7038 RepID=A0A9P0FAB0_BEMTA|nr:unnamed protein product [Bemisia tabaci]
MLDVTFCLLITLLLTIITRSIIERSRNRKIHAFMKTVSGPMTIPFVGSAYVLAGINRLNLFRVIRNLDVVYPGSKGFWIFGDPYLVTSDPSVFKAVLGSSQNINKTRDYEYFQKHCHGIFTTNGAAWRNMRKTINPAFRTKVLESFGENFKFHTENFLEILRKYSSSEDNFDLFTTVHSCTIDLICENMLGYCLDVQKKGLIHYSTNLQRSTEMIFERSFSFPLWSRLIYVALGKMEELDAAVKPMQDICRKIVNERLKQKLDSQSENADKTESVRNFMEIMLENIQSGAVTQDQAVEEAIEIFLSGSTTTAGIMSWVFQTLAMWPEIQRRVHQEIVENCNGDEVTTNDLSKLVYLEMVIKETLRHYTVPFIARHIDEDLKVDEETTIPAGMNVLLVTFSMHHDPNYWERPGDFYPEHFSAKNESARQKGVFLPLSGGPRICAGNKYAMISMKYLIANTLLHCEFRSDRKPPADIREDDFRIVFVLCPTHGFSVTVTDRNLRKCSKTDSVIPSLQQSTVKHQEGHIISEFIRLMGPKDRVLR